MIDDPVHWSGYLAGYAREQRLGRRFGLSDRVRYYWAAPGVREAVERLYANLRGMKPPRGLLSQFFPSRLPFEPGAAGAGPDDLVRAAVRDVLRSYHRAAAADPLTPG
jgi:D-tagatose-1,6-bisphosphate aldolase subunit GatZ/KbaZ